MGAGTADRRPRIRSVCLSSEERGVAGFRSKGICRNIIEEGVDPRERERNEFCIMTMFFCGGVKWFKVWDQVINHWEHLKKALRGQLRND